MRSRAFVPVRLGGGFRFMVMIVFICSILAGGDGQQAHCRQNHVFLFHLWFWFVCGPAAGPVAVLQAVAGMSRPS